MVPLPQKKRVTAKTKGYKSLGRHLLCVRVCILTTRPSCVHLQKLHGITWRILSLRMKRKIVMLPCLLSSFPLP
jgi:hypothetical protein